MNPSSLDCFELTGKAILVTGSTRGIGKAIALKLGAAKAHVGVTFTGTSAASEENAKQVCEEIIRSGGKAHAYRLDVSNEAQVSEVVDAFTKEAGGLYGLVNNAGITVDNLMMRYKVDDWNKVLDTNLKGAFLVSKAALRPLMKAGGSSIVNMSSVVGEMGNAGQVAYSASKAGLIGMTKSMAREYGGKKLRVNCIAPGFIETDMTHALGEGQKETLLSGIALGQLGQVDDIAWGCLYLLSGVSRYVTGQVLSINGGLYM
jgi:3-oxoacyl-[acyl-carrier protein] reductase